VATAAPSDPVNNGVIFAAQLSELISQHLSEGNRAAFDHQSQLFGLILVAKGIFIAHGQESDVVGFKKMVDHVWRQDGLIKVVRVEP